MIVVTTPNSTGMSNSQGDRNPITITVINYTLKGFYIVVSKECLPLCKGSMILQLHQNHMHTIIDVRN